MQPCPVRSCVLFEDHQGDHDYGVLASSGRAPVPMHSYQTIRFDAELLEDVQRNSDASERTFAQTVRRACRYYLQAVAEGKVK